MEEAKTKRELSLEMRDLEEVKDSLYTVHLLFFLTGIVHILPFSFFVTATDYWMYKFRDTSRHETSSKFRTSLQTLFAPSLTITLNVANILFVVLSMLYAHKIKLKNRLIGSLSVILLCFLVTAIFVEINTDSWQVGFFAIVMVIVAVINAMNSLFGFTLYAVLANFPEIYLASYFNGQGLAAVFSSSLEIASLAVGIDTQNSALVYFGLGAFVVCFALISLVAIHRNEFYLYHMKGVHKEETERMSFTEVRTVMRKIWTSIAILLTYCLTATPVHTSVTSLIVSEGEKNGPWNDVYFVPVVTFFLHALFDLAGRGVATKLKFNYNGGYLSLISFFRIFIFVPLLMLCNAQPRHHLPVVFPHDYQYIIIMAVFSFSNGFLVILSGLQIPKLVPPEELKHGYQVYMVVAGIIASSTAALGFITVKIL